MATPKSKVDKDNMVRVQGAVVVIQICLIYLVVALFTVLLGFHGTIAHLGNYLPVLNAQLQVANGEITKEAYLDNKLGVLLATSLPYRMFETHEECLIRGVTFADVQYLSFDFTEHESIRNNTAKWVEDACASRHFQPQVVDPDTQQQRLTAWAHFCENLEGVLTAVKQLTLSVREKVARWFGVEVNKVSVKKPIAAHESPFQKKDWSMHPLPRHFSLAGCDPPPCHLLYNAPDNTPVNVTDTATLYELLPVLEKERDILLTHMNVLSDLEVLLHAIFSALIAMELAMIPILGFISAAMPQRSRPDLTGNFVRRFWSPLYESEKSILIWALAETCLIPIRLLFDEFQHLLSLAISTLPICLGFMGLAFFTVPSVYTPNMFDLFAAAKDLVLVGLNRLGRRAVKRDTQSLQEGKLGGAEVRYLSEELQDACGTDDWEKITADEVSEIGEGL
ncbi:hypothetical protein P154DRAFT_570852 [Amniculicola lignicola CBS 123094]|uniref:Uncharacterized protein n=1 Tax=Amniculicola lignicola CBS 123094 TaxID=1392246 RepID=A0A6A5X2J0_9PLEO|nr:hypothetical protein P154DRAFT_570852 [Amniculicola lignicola CBS 123094]